MPCGRSHRGELTGLVARRSLPPGRPQLLADPLGHGHPIARCHVLEDFELAIIEQHLEPLTHAMSLSYYSDEAMSGAMTTGSVVGAACRLLVMVAGSHGARRSVSVVAATARAVRAGAGVAPCPRMLRAGQAT